MSRVLASRVSGSSKNSEEPLSWPQSVSHKPTHRIGEVKKLLNDEFPMLSVSKIRHYEDFGLIEPYRTATNQRLFSPSDLERIRYILREQRDRYLPLKQIKEVLHQLDTGIISENSPRGTVRAVSDDNLRPPKPGERLRLTRVAALTGAPLELVNDMAQAGILAVDPRGRVNSSAVDVVKYSLLLLERGYDVRQIRTIRNSAHAHAVMLTGHLSTDIAKKTTVARERALNQATEDASSMAHLYEALLAENLETELR
ncbi:MerR family transcriptional regulator [Actinotignum urinale]|uniref:transcriptional regulator FtsR n=1 Tax=Actinotignum urinale TaxID=190146 RepID=UPI002A828369|nr:MerR family transcriptional regulator [Actinotignum urinale]MDY5128840.1 MerR family transcriptional regulator [Actinotignum urinale]